MKLEQQVTSLEISKRLKEFGVKQESLFFYSHYGKLRTNESLYEAYLEDYNNKDFPWHGKYPSWLSEVNGGDIFSAFTVAELGEMLPQCIRIKRQCFILRIVKGNSMQKDGYQWLVTFENDQKNLEIQTTGSSVGSTEADARGKMLIYLLENKLITLCV